MLAFLNTPLPNDEIEAMQFCIASIADVGDGVGVGTYVAVGSTVGVGDGSGEGLGDGSGEGLGVGSGDGLGEGVGIGVAGTSHVFVTAFDVLVLLWKSTKLASIVSVPVKVPT